MPPKNNKTDAKDLSPAEIEILKKWIDLGAKDSVKTQSKVVWQALEPGVHPIYTLAMTKDGRFAACGRSNQISVYDLATQQFVTRIVDSAENPAGAHRALVHSLAFSPDGSRLASGGYREVKIWSRESAKSISRKGDPALSPVVSTLTPDGKQIVSADKSGNLSLLNAVDGKVIKEITPVGPTGIKFLSVSPDGSKLAVFAEGWNLSVWNLADGKLLAKQTAPDSALELLSKEAQANLAAAVNKELATTVALQKAQAAKTVATKSLAGIKAKVAAAANPELQKQLADANGKVAAAIKAEANAGGLAKAAQTAKTVAEKSAGDAAKKLDQARKVAMGALSWTPDSKAVITGGDDKTVRVWPLPAPPSTTFTKPKELAGATEGIVAFATGPDLLVAASKDSKLRIWSLSGA
jgi:WD40 repeat protein